MPNRLANSNSPYLLQHQDNPVDWWPWCDEAWQKAIELQLPVFLSVGYSSCHWCHVMAHESFESEVIAEALNKNFICIKLDREERPDIDEIYMTAVQISNGHGGWPMSLFLTPEKKPFYAGTYFPISPRGEFPGFLTLINSLASAWQDSRQEVLNVADEFNSALSGALERTLPTSTTTISPDILDRAIDAYHQDFDHENGGFGDSPKFPPHSKISFLLDYALHRPELPGDFGDLADRAAEMALMTLEKICLGGIYDHVAGGLHRYSTDGEWHLPHFEKMLYDNGQFLAVLAHSSRLSADPRLAHLFNRKAQQTVNWLREELRAEDGTFMSALDADSEGKEGTFYVWGYDELAPLVSPEFLKAAGCQPGGNFRDEATGVPTGENVLHFALDPGDQFDTDLAALKSARGRRPRPDCDYKALASWNGLAIGALASLGEIELAKQAANVWINIGPEVFPHMISRGNASGTPFLDDLAMMADGLINLYEATQDEKYLDFANKLADKILISHKGLGGSLYFSAKDEELHIGRTQPFLDGATPSPIGIAIRVFRRLGRKEEALQSVRAGLGWVEHAPRATESILREILWLLIENGGQIEHSQQATTQSQLSIILTPNPVIREDDGWAYCEVVAAIPPDLHINSNEPIASWLIPTEIQIDGAYGEASFPESQDGTYRGELRIVLRLKPKSEADAEFRVRLRYQACTDSECFAPAEVAVSGTLVIG